ncbi:MAG: hypothetical protein LN414_06955 [Candidatus Thermoplasmatota archaeon]|nr:hypothetical protein [Candidatus Thermoplasmatota archaeon]
MSRPPFEGLFGDTPEGRLLEHFLSLPRFTFTVNELLEHVDISRPTLMKKIRRFVELEVINEIRSVRPMVFQLNGDSDLVEAVNLLNYALIDQIVPGHGYFETGVRKAFPPEQAIELENLPGREGKELPTVRIVLDRGTARRLTETLEDLVVGGSVETI